MASLLALAYHVLGEPALNSLVEELMTTNLLIKVLGEQLEQSIVQGRRHDILRVLRRRYPVVPDGLAARVDRMSDPEQLDTLLDAAMDASSLEEFAQVLDR